jgi:hypothetical protein
MQPGWFNSNSMRAFPFLRGSVDQPVTGPLTLGNLPNAIVVDCGFLLGPHSGFIADVHVVQLQRITRQGSTFLFEFTCDAPSLHRAPLQFHRHVGDERNLTERVSSQEEGLSLSDSLSEGGCAEPLWSGFLTTGSMEALELLLPANGSVLNPGGAAEVEPSLIHNLDGAMVTSFGVANDDRVRVEAPEGCDDPVWDYPTGLIFVHGHCLQNEIILKPGYNAVIRQSDQNNSLTVGAAVGAGAGEPCETVPLFSGETAPDGSNLLEGGPQCNEVLRTINGLSGPLLNLLTSGGIVVTSMPDANALLVNVNMSGLALCFNSISEVSESDST